jgi:5-methylcytosine-specific restriction endonuclease McrA
MQIEDKDGLIAMIYVPREGLKFPENWEERVHKAQEEIKDLTPEERIKRINACAFIWHELKRELEKCSHHKCWYCESNQDRSDNNVDHFRPKGRVAECSDHEGYWWLAFEWTNYRFSCTFCNSRRKDLETSESGGKGDYFPLLDESKRARSPSDKLEEEQPLLLDPVKTTDPGLLWFDQNGLAVPKFSSKDRPILYRRAIKSIELYNLNYYKTLKKRSELYKDILKLVRAGDRYFNGYANGDSDLEYALDQVYDRLRIMLNEKAEFSAATRSYLLGLRNDNREWIDAVFTTC